MSGVDQPQARRRLRPNALQWGVITGAVLPVAVLLGFIGLLKLWSPDASARFNVDMSSVGADVTRHGGRRVIFANERGSVVQFCNGECDDVRRQESSGDNSYWVRVLDAQGRCVACSSGGYVTNGMETRLRVAGMADLDIRESSGDGPAFSVKSPADRAERPPAPR